MPRRGADSGFSGPLTAIAVAGIALGVVVMVMAVSILEGFRQDITQKVSGFGSHMTLTAYGPAQTARCWPAWPRCRGWPMCNPSPPKAAW